MTTESRDQWDRRQAHALDPAAELVRIVTTMLGAAETDCLDDKSNVWRSAMIDARAAIAKYEGK